MAIIFGDFDSSEFWENSEYAFREYVSQSLTPKLISLIEEELGYKLPASYIELMNHQNGGIPNNSCFPINTETAEAHITISGIFAIDREKAYSLCGEMGSQFMIEDWGYPNIGLYFADCPSAGHDMVCLDYRKNGKNGEPEVVYVDQGDDYKITFLAENFEGFIKGLVHESIYE
jgi:SMI1-KNR4 cell-wall